MHDPRLSLYQNVKALKEKTVEQIELESINRDLSSKNKMQGSFLKTWVHLTRKQNKKISNFSDTTQTVGRINGFIRKESYISKIARYLLVIGLDRAALIISELEEAEITEIIREIATIDYIFPEEKEIIIKEFTEILGREKNKIKIDKNFTYDFLNKTLGKQKATVIYRKATGLELFVPFSYLREIENEQLWMLITTEHINTLVIIFSYLTIKQKKFIFYMFDNKQKKEFIKELIKPKKVNNEMVEFISNVLKRKFEIQGKIKTQKIDGSKVLVDILSYMDINTEREILNRIDMQSINPIKDNEIKEKLFGINIVLRIKDNDLHNILRKFTDREISIIIKGQSNEIRDKILFNISRRRKTLVLDEEFGLQGIKTKEIKNTITVFLNYILNQDQENQILIYRKNEEFI